MYDASIDIGLAVKEDPVTANSRRKKKRRKRKRSASVVGEGSVEIRCTSSAVDTLISGGIGERLALLHEGNVNQDRRGNKDAVVGTLSDQIAVTKQTVKRVEISMPPLKGNYSKERSNLPIYHYRNELCNLISKNDVVLVVAETVRPIYHYLCSRFFN